MEGAGNIDRCLLQLCAKIEEGNLLIEINLCSFSENTREWVLIAAGGCFYPIPQCPDNFDAKK
jgi:hypothetical protein